MVSRLFADGILPDKVRAPPTAKSYRKACDKLPPAVVELFQQQAHEQAYSTDGATYNGYKVIVVDGTKIAMTATEETTKEYGVADGHYAQCLGMGFYELSTGTFEKFEFEHRNASERGVAQAHMESNRVTSLYLADAGYNGMAFIALTGQAGHAILMPLKMGALRNNFRKSKKRSLTVDVTLTRSHLKNYPQNQNLVGEKIKVRLVRSPGTSKLKSQVLITTLLDEKMYPWQELCSLYRQRYTVELAFRHLKQKIRIEKIRKHKLSRIQQRLYAAVALYNIAAIIRNRVKRPTLLPHKAGVKLICFSFCIEVTGLFVKAALKMKVGMKAVLKRYVVAIQSCVFTYMPWRASPRICRTPPSEFTTHKGTEAKGEIEKARFVSQELKILKVKYEAMGV